MELILIIAIILIFVILNGLPFIFGALNTPSGSVFLGTVHWPGDYFYYLSQFAQGKDSWFLSYDLYTNDFPYKTMVGWVNVFLGHLFSLVGVDYVTVYQLSIVIFAASFLGLSYLLIREIFPPTSCHPDPAKGGRRISHGCEQKTPIQARFFASLRMTNMDENREKRIIAFILFVTSNAFPKITSVGGKWSLSYYDFWFNNGIPFNRLGGVPHHLIGRTVVVLAILLAIRWWRNIYYIKRTYVVFNILFFLVLGLILASVEPVQWILTVVILILTPLLYLHIIPFTKFLLHKVKSQKSKVKITSQNSNIIKNKFLQPITYNLQPFFPSILLFLGGLPMAIYLKRFFASPPYLQLAVWENSQQVSVPVWTFIMSNGPVMVLAIVGLVLSFYHQTGPADSSPPISAPHSLRSEMRAYWGSPTRVTRFLIIIFPMLTIGLFFSPVPRWVSIVNVRFLPAATTLFLAIMASEAISIISARRWLILCFILIILAPTYFLQIQNRIKTESANAFFYVTQSVYESYKEAEKISSQNDTFLVIWPFNWSFPGITGRRVYEGHSLLTSNYDNKELLTRSFFFGDMKITDMEKMLRVNRIDYVMTYPWTGNINELSNVKKVFDNRSLAIYKVK